MKTTSHNRRIYVTQQFRHFANVTGFPVHIHWREAPKEGEAHDDPFAGFDGIHSYPADVVYVDIAGLDRWEYPHKKHSKRLDELCDRMEAKYPGLRVEVENTIRVEEPFAPVAYTPEQQAFHEATTHNRVHIEASQQCGCYACERIFAASEVTADCYCGDDTVCCPYCGIDSVLGDASGYPITNEYLHKLHHKWFE